MSGKAFDWLTPERIWKWARAHPGTIVVGALLVTVLLAPLAQSHSRPLPEAEADEAPLFI